MRVVALFPDDVELDPVPLLMGGYDTKIADDYVAQYMYNRGFFFDRYLPELRIDSDRLSDGRRVWVSVYCVHDALTRLTSQTKSTT